MKGARILVIEMSQKMILERVPLTVTYHRGLPPLRSILDEHSSILNVSEKPRQLSVRNPPLVAYRRPPNLRTLLVRAHCDGSQLTKHTYINGETLWFVSNH